MTEPTIIDELKAGLRPVRAAEAEFQAAEKVYLASDRAGRTAAQQRMEQKKQAFDQAATALYPWMQALVARLER